MSWLVVMMWIIPSKNIAKLLRVSKKYLLLQSKVFE